MFYDMFYRDWECEADWEIVFVSFVRACERSCVWPRNYVVSAAGLRKLAACSRDVCRAVPFRALPCAVTLLC